MTYTKGEWIPSMFGLRYEVKPDDIAITNEQDNLICVVVNESDTQREDRANANLIAASPNMYEALKNVLFDLENEGEIMMPTVDEINKALAKVEGKGSS